MEITLGGGHLTPAVAHDVEVRLNEILECCDNLLNETEITPSDYYVLQDLIHTIITNTVVLQRHLHVN